MPFEPIPVTGHMRKNAGHPISYRLETKNGKHYLFLSVKEHLLDQVKGPNRFWRLDVDEAKGLCRITGLIQHDGNNATRAGTKSRDKSASRRFGWVLGDTAKLFEEHKISTPLRFVEIDSQGVIFKLPKA